MKVTELMDSLVVRGKAVLSFHLPEGAVFTMTAPTHDDCQIVWAYRSGEDGETHTGGFPAGEVSPAVLELLATTETP